MRCNTLAHDDAMVLKGLDQADIIMVGVSRSGKTPTCLYIALKYGTKAANYPLTSDDFDQHAFPKEILKYKDKLVVTTISPQRLHHIREKRRPMINVVATTFIRLHEQYYRIPQAKAY